MRALLEAAAGDRREEMSRRHGVDAERLLRDLEALSAFGALEGGGMDRPPFSVACRDAEAWLRDRMRAAGLAVRTDAAGNVFGRLGPETGPAVLCGSHVDTVPNGGRFDGALGVVAALECARILAEREIPLARALEVCSFTDEEGSYVSLLGSRAITGGLEPDEIERSVGRTGERASDAMRRCGLDPARLPEARRPASEIAAYLELHIEQGPVLGHANADIGVVTGLVGIETLRLTFSGAARHAGTTPFDARRDALRGAAAAITECLDRMEDGAWGAHDYRLNFGAIEVAPGVSNVVPGEARVTCELRAAEATRMTEIGCRVWAACEREAGRLGLSLMLEAMSYDLPASMDDGLQDLIEASAAELGLTSLRLPSGAGHDAQALAAIAPSGMIFIPSQGGVSHHPDEFSTDEQVVKGANVLLRALTRLVMAD